MIEKLVRFWSFCIVHWQSMLLVDQLYFVFHGDYTVLQQAWCCSVIDILLENMFDFFYNK